MSPDSIAIGDIHIIAAIMALKPTAYVIRLGLAVLAFGAAMSAEKVVARVIGFVWLVLAGCGLLILGIMKGTILDIVLGIVALVAAGYSWWYTRM